MHRQTKPAIGLNATGNPFIVWVDNRNGNDDIFYAGSTEISAPLSTIIIPVGGAVTVQSTEDTDLQVQIPNGALPNGVNATDITIAEVTNPPTPLPPGGFGMAYDFGPSGAVFNSPVTIRIPLADDAPVYSTYLVYRYDAGIGDWIKRGFITPPRRLLSPTARIWKSKLTTSPYSWQPAYRQSPRWRWWRWWRVCTFSVSRMRPVGVHAALCCVRAAFVRHDARTQAQCTADEAEVVFLFFQPSAAWAQKESPVRRA